MFIFIAVSNLMLMNYEILLIYYPRSYKKKVEAKILNSVFNLKTKNFIQPIKLS
jgi:hypothetical protein